MKKHRYILGGLTLVLGGTFLICLALGSVAVPLRAIIDILFKGDGTSSHMAIIKQVRLPRVLAVMLVGMSLSLAGTVMQGLLRNPLADGSTLGVSAGASLGAILGLVLSLSFPVLPFSTTFVMASLGAFLSLIFILSLAYAIDRSYSNPTIILVGIIFSMFTSAIINVLLVLAQDRLKTIVFWSLGSLAGAKMLDVGVLVSVLFLSLVIIMRHTQDLNAFVLGEEHALSLGVAVKRTRLLLLLAVSILVGTSVAVGGTIAFVGLIIPHMARLLLGTDHRTLVPAATLAGGSFLMWADLLARTAFRPQEMPIGVITSFIGTLILLTIMFARRKSV